MVQTFEDSLWDKKRIDDQLGGVGGDRIVINKWRTEEVGIYDANLKIEERAIGSIFYLSHSTNGDLSDGNILGPGASYTDVEEITANQRITKTGVSKTAQAVFGETTNYPTVLGYGTGVGDFSDTQTELITEVDKFSSSDYPVTITITDASGSVGECQIDYVWEINDIVQASIIELGLFNSDSDMFGRRVITSLSMVVTKEYKFTLTLKVRDL